MRKLSELQQEIESVRFGMENNAKSGNNWSGIIFLL